ncbi:MAG: hypothetical protein LC790_13805 [Actinobacteria bacterium]|nr:hypothetical protein [Actinomycetota bacterium]
MPNGLRRHLSYANVVSTLCLFILLGGVGYAAATITGRDVKNSSLTWRDLKRNTLGGSRIKESRLGRVPRAANADRVGGLGAAQLLVRCPAGTFPAGGTCIEATARPAQAYGSAVRVCADAGGDRTPGRRLPTHGELQAAYSRVDSAPGGELTGNVYLRADGNLDVLVTNKVGPNTIVANDGNTPKAFRCAADPFNY